MPARGAAQLSRTPAEYHDHMREQRQRTMAALLAQLRAAADAGEDWYRWVADRAAGVHRHGLTDAAGRTVACPVAGCDAGRGTLTPHAAAGSRRGRGEPR